MFLHIGSVQFLLKCHFFDCLYSHRTLVSENRPAIKETMFPLFTCWIVFRSFTIMKQAGWLDPYPACHHRSSVCLPSSSSLVFYTSVQMMAQFKQWSPSRSRLGCRPQRAYVSPGSVPEEACVAAAAAGSAGCGDLHKTEKWRETQNQCPVNNTVVPLLLTSWRPCYSVK